jgi:hypothetical protein
VSLLCAVSFLVGVGCGQPSLPDPALTPGAVIPNYKMICVPPYAPPRVWHDKRGTLAKQGIPLSSAYLYEDDDRVPTCLGGNNADPKNHWAQPCTRWSPTHRCLAGDAHDKDVQLELPICRAVCAGRMTVPEGQAIFLGDWRPYLGHKF